MMAAKAKAKARKPARDTILFIHGMWGGGHQWRGWQDIFEASGYATLAPSLRHHDVDPRGEAPAELGRVSLLDYVADLEAEIAKLPGKPVIVGHSMGGLIAQILASRGQAKAAIFITPAPPSGLPAIIQINMPSVLAVMLGKTLGPGLTDRPHRMSFRKAAYSCLNNLPKARQEEEYGKWVWESGRVLFEIAYWFLNRSRASRVDPKLITVPTLTIACARDRIVPKPVVARIAGRYKAGGGEYRIYDDRAHFIIAEEGWEAFAEDCAAWIEAAVGVKAGG
ncbi:MAG: alpha/beta hydrolase [Alphaproteobacteria bacterium]